MAPRSVIYLVSFLAIALALVGAYFAFKNDSAENERLTAETVATIENVDVRRAVDPIFGSESTVDISVTYRYEIDDQEYHQTTRLSKSQAEAFVPWSTAKVCFEPGNASTVKEGKLFPQSHKCGGD